MSWKEIINGSQSVDGSNTLLSPGEEVALFEDIERGRRAGARMSRGSNGQEKLRQVAREVGEEAVLRVVRGNIGLVVDIASRYRDFLEWDDLLQEGLIGLLKAVERFDHRRGLRFSTLAVWWIRQGISRAVAQQGRTIRLPERRLARVRQLERKRYDMTESGGAVPTLDELAGVLGMSREALVDLEISGEGVVSLDACEVVDQLALREHAEGGDVESIVEMREAIFAMERLISQLPLEQSDAVRESFGIALREEGMGRGNRRKRNRLAKEGVRRMRELARARGLG